MAAPHASDFRLLPKPRLHDLIQLLAGDGYEVVGPRLDQGAIVYDAIQAAADLPVGWTDEQTPGSYRLRRRDDDFYFGYAVGPHSWKKYLFPAALTLWQAQRTAAGFEVRAAEPDPPRRAFLGVRSCELHALAIQDRVFIDRAGVYSDPHYTAARARLFLVAVECGTPGGTCFCTSMGTGPEVQLDRPPAPPSANPEPSARVPLPLAARPAPPSIDCDLVLTELAAAFLVRAASPAGATVVERLQLAAAADDDVAEAQQRVQAAAAGMGRTVDVQDVRALLHRNQEHPRWDDVASRCLACTNCTLVCPTCFCSSTEDVTDLAVQTAERVRRWDSCFTPEFGRVHGGNYRPSVRGRYRQWLTHKFASWFDQFDVSGCVGCGRCITWCPVGIDVTAEISAIRTADGQRKESAS